MYLSIRLFHKERWTKAYYVSEKHTYKSRSEEIRKKEKTTDALNQALKMKWQSAGHVARFTDGQ